MYALGTDQLYTLIPRPAPPSFRLEGPALFDEARRPVDGFYNA